MLKISGEILRLGRQDEKLNRKNASYFGDNVIPSGVIRSFTCYNNSLR